MAADRDGDGASTLAGLPLRVGDAGLWARRVGLGVLALFCAAGLAGVFGQDSHRSSATGAAGVRLEVDAPDRLRGGLLGQVRIVVRSDARVAAPRLVLGPGFVEQVTINSVIPAPADEGERDGRWVLAYGPLAAGTPLTIRVQFQVNALNMGTRDQSVTFRDGDRTLAHVARRVTVFP